MFAILSIVDAETIRVINNLRASIAETCQITSNIYALEPHLSWQAAMDYPVDRVGKRLEKISLNLPPLDLSIGGIGVFTGPKPVVYFSVTRSPVVELYHKRIWNATSRFGKEVNPYFSPERWIPHISLFYVRPDAVNDLPCALAKLIGTQFEFQVRLNQLSLAFDEDGKFGIQSTFEFNREVM